MFGILKKLFGTAQDRLLKKYAKLVIEVNRHEQTMQRLSDEELRAKTDEFRRRLAAGESLDSLLPEAYAAVKNCCRRLCGTEMHVSGYNQKWDMIPYDVQILGGIAMHFGAIAEMQTGEGKTLTAAMPLYLNALTGKPVHLVTVNDYLASRDCQWIGAIFRTLGLTVGAITGETPPHTRRAIYQNDIVYGTASEFGFDYLRDNSMAHTSDEQCQRGHYFAMIDEVDSILIDEARTPLIISGPTSNPGKQMFDELKEGVTNLVRLQRETCNRLATEAKKTLESVGWMTEESLPKLGKKEMELAHEALRKLWLVNKGMPRNKILRRVREIPSLRSEIDKWDTYYYAEPNKQEKLEALATLELVVDERGNEFELTDRGIEAWDHMGQGYSKQDFVMLDLGHEYGIIDHNSDLNEEQKLEARIRIREEDAIRKEKAHSLRQLLRAHLMMDRDVDYIVADGKIVIIDENTGRPQPGRRFSDGLHQAIEAKEGVSIQGETQTYATITLQNYFRMYEKLSGMTGTAMTEAGEFKEIYKLDVLAIPTHKNCCRVDDEDEVYMTEREKWSAILQEIKRVHEHGRPILVGTDSVEASEKLSRILRQNSLEHTVLNAKHHAKEAEVIADAGRAGAITVATNMAGRGTDIKMQGESAKRGGLHVIGTTRHTSRRIDRQLRGRCARQGDPGSSKFFLSFEDQLMRLFTSPNVSAILMRFRPPEGEAIKAGILTKSVETAQTRLEQRNYTMRKHTLEYDDVMNQQRKEVYALRGEVLHCKDPLKLAEEILSEVCCHKSAELLTPSSNFYSPMSYRSWLMTQFPVDLPEAPFQNESAPATELEHYAIEKVVELFREKIEAQVASIELLRKLAKDPSLLPDGREMVGRIVRRLFVQTLDRLWQEHLLHIDHLRTETQLQSVAQKNPLEEFKHEAFALFAAFSVQMREEIAHALFRFRVMMPPPAPIPSLRKLHQEIEAEETGFEEQNDTDSSSGEEPEEEPDEEARAHGPLPKIQLSLISAIESATEEEEAVEDLSASEQL